MISLRSGAATVLNAAHKRESHFINFTLVRSYEASIPSSVALTVAGQRQDQALIVCIKERRFIPRRRDRLKRGRFVNRPSLGSHELPVYSAKAASRCCSCGGVWATITAHSPS